MAHQSPGAKVACLACREKKLRCNGQNPCARCHHNKEQCAYLPSRRGGVRKGPRFERAKQQQQQQQEQQRAAIDNSQPARTSSLVSVGTDSPPVGNVVSPSSSLNVSSDRARFSHAPSVNAAFTAISSRISHEIRPIAHTSLYTPHHASSNLITIRIYTCEKDLIDAYYVFVHPYLPLLPPPVSTLQYQDRPVGLTSPPVHPDRATLPSWLTSPFSLALSAILVLIPMSGDPHALSIESMSLRRSYAEFYVQEAEKTLELISNRPQPPPISEPSTAYTPTCSSNFAYPDVPSHLQPLLALLILTVYDYCQRGDRKRMRSRAYQALMTAMDLSLHAIDLGTPEDSEMQRRAWWITMFLVYQACIFNHSVPIMLIDDPRIKTDYPKISGRHEPWVVLVKAQNALSSAGTIAKSLVKADESFLRDMKATEIPRIDSEISALMTELNMFRHIAALEGVEAAAARNLWIMARLLTHTSRIKLHRFIAFRDFPIFLESHCDLRSIDFFPLISSPTPALNINSTYDATEQRSANICLRSALALSRLLSDLQSSNASHANETPMSGISAAPAPTGTNPAASVLARSLPYLACCGIQSCYVLIMTLLRIRAALYSSNLSTCQYLLGQQPEGGIEADDAERLIEELRNGMKALTMSLRSDSIFAGIVGMGREIEGLYSTTFPD